MEPPPIPPPPVPPRPVTWKRYWPLIVLVLIVAGGVGFLIVSRVQASVAEGAAFADRVVPAFLAHGDVAILVENITPEARAATDPARLRALSEMVTRLGPLLTYEGTHAAWQWRSDPAPQGEGTFVSARYVAHALFQNGGATLHFTLIKMRGRWMIAALFINSQTSDRPTLGI